MIEKMKIKISSKGIHPNEREQFSGTILNGKEYKIYIVSLEGVIVYVGKTKQTIGDKFRQSILTYQNVQKGKKKVSGYSGYKWVREYLDKGVVLDLSVFLLPGKTNEETEAIEAEVVYLVREKTGRWPEYQNEIHFRNNEEAKRVAEGIYNSMHKGEII